MEGVPRLYMIGIPAKRCIVDRIPDFATTLNHHLKQSYDRDPSLYSADIDTLLELRQSAMNAVMSSVCSVDDCTALKRYYAHLVRITDKFPKLMQQKIVGIKNLYDDVENIKSGEPTPSLTFTWKRTLGGKINRHANDIDAASIVDSGDIGYEMRCVLFNLGAAHSRLASAQNRSPPLETSNMSTTVGEESSNTALKIACTHLQCSAWAFQQLLGSGDSKNEHTKWHHRQQPPVTSRAVLEFAYNVTLAQAQECILEKSMMDGRKPLIIAKVSAMICEYFAGAVNAVLRVEREPLCVSANRIEKWRLYSEFKCRYYGAVTALFQGQHVQDQLQQMGTRVSYYRRAVNLLGRAGQISENGGKTMTMVLREDDSADDDYYYYLVSEAGRIGTGRLAATKELEMRRDTLSFAMDVAAAKWRAAKSENELIYHEPVVPVLSDEDDSDCLGNSSSSTSSSHQLERVKGASLVKPIGFSVDDPELLAVIVNNSESSTTTTTILFRDIVPTVTRHRVATYRTEKCNLKAYIQSLCQEADDRLTAFSDRLHLECLDMYKDNGSNHESDENDVKNKIPQELVNCCAAYQALLHQRREERERDPSIVNIEDQLDIDMDRLSAAVHAVDGMLDEIDRLLKTEELGDSEYRRTVGRPYDYSASRMRELRLEASRYREAHVGRARDSWVTLSRAVRDRRRRDLELLALPPDELAARLPPLQPTLFAIASEVATSDNVDSTLSYNSESSDPNENSESEDETGGRLQQSRRESIMRLDRLKMVVDKMQEVREQRQPLLSRFLDEMDREDKDAVDAGQDDSDVIVELRGSNLDVSEAVKKKLDDRYGTIVNLIERNLAAQQKVLDAVRTAYVRAAHERRAYANAVQRRQTLVASLIDAYESFVVANGGTPLQTRSDMVAVSPTSGLLPDTVLAERCAKGLEFYQRMITNVSKLLQRVKGACQVQTEQRDQIIKQHRQWETQQSDDDTDINIDGFDDILNAVSPVEDQDHKQDDLASLVDKFGSNVGLNKPPVPLGGHWNQQHYLRRLSPLGSEQQKQHLHQYSHCQTQQPSSSTFTTGVSGGVIDFYDYYYKNKSGTNKYNTGQNVNVNTTQQQQQLATYSMYPAVTAEYNVAVGSTVVASPINSTVVSLSSPISTSTIPYNYYSYQLPTVSSAINSSLSSPSYNNIPTLTGSTIEKTCLRTNNGGVLNNVSSYSQSGGSSIFPNAAAAVAALQRPLPSPYSVGNSSNIANITGGIGYGTSRDFGYHQPTPALPQQQQQFYSQQYQQQISTTPSITTGGSTSVGSAGVFLQQQQQIIANGSSVPASVQSPLSFSSPSISSSVNNSSITTSLHSSVAISGGNSTNANYFHHLPVQQQQLQLYQQQQTQLYQQQQQPQLYQQKTQLYQQQPQIYQQPQLTNISQNIPGNLHYTPLSQQHQQPNQLYQSHQLQPNALMTNQQQPSSSLSNNSGCNNYYQQPQQYHPPTTVAQLNTTTMAIDNYYYRQPQIATLPAAFIQHQQQPQYYQQQLPAVTSPSTPVNLLDDDLLISGPPPIQPEKISINGGNDSTTTTSTANTNK